MKRLNTEPLPCSLLTLATKITFQVLTPHSGGDGPCFKTVKVTENAYLKANIRTKNKQTKKSKY